MKDIIIKKMIDINEGDPYSFAVADCIIDNRLTMTDLANCTVCGIVIEDDTRSSLENIIDMITSMGYDLLIFDINDASGTAIYFIRDILKSDKYNTTYTEMSGIYATRIVFVKNTLSKTKDGD